jgi:hypothetical protein
MFRSPVFGSRYLFGLSRARVGRQHRTTFASIGLLLALFGLLTACGASSLQGGQASPTPSAPPALARDTFVRADQSYWGTASNGQAWGGDANTLGIFSISGNAGQIANGTGTAVSAVLGPLCTTAEVTLTASVSRFANANVGPVLRWQDDSNWYKAYIDGTSLLLQKRVGGTRTNLAIRPFAASAGTAYNLRFRAVGAVLSVNVWAAGSTEPSGWMLTATDSTFASGRCGLRAQTVAGITVRVTAFLADVPPGSVPPPTANATPKATATPTATAKPIATSAPPPAATPKPTPTPTPTPGTAVIPVISEQQAAAAVAPVINAPQNGASFTGQNVVDNTAVFAIPFLVVEQQQQGSPYMPLVVRDNSNPQNDIGHVSSGQRATISARLPCAANYDLHVVQVAYEDVAGSLELRDITDAAVTVNLLCPTPTP